jgi:tetratricopeptide (TPR) repeat protein
MTSQHPVFRAMISSTIADLPEHRAEAMDACLRQDFFPSMMEHLPSDPSTGLEASLRLTDQADVYILILGARYGFVPAGLDVSITHAEYRRASARGIPILAFLADETHPFPLGTIETGLGAERLLSLRKEVEAGHTVSYFRSSQELGKLIVDAIAGYRRPGRNTFHFVSDIRSPPEPYIAHPYVLADRSDIVGRHNEMDLLTDWASGVDDKLSSIRVLAIVAIGGMGKSALTWKWFSEISPEEMRPLAGRLWWSFYESDATFENFIVRALAYVRRMPREDALAIPAAEREQQLLDTLDLQPFLFCLDGLERIMLAYARADATSMAEDSLDDDAENFIRAMPGAPEYAVESMSSRKRLRKTTDPRAGAFLRRLSRVRASRILISTRLYPADLQGATGLELAGCKAMFLGGLKDTDAVALWRALGVRGRRDTLLKVFRSVDNYPLLIRVLAGEITHFRPAPGDFDAWIDENPDFDPFSLPLVQRKTHILQFSLRALPAQARQLLITLAAFRMPASYDMLNALFLGEGAAFTRPSELHAALAELEERGLAGWDRRANRYDLHPVVRGVVWHGLNRVGREIVLENMHAHLTTLPAAGDLRAPSVDDLAPSIELYHTLVSLGRHDEAFKFYSHHLNDLLVNHMNRFRLGANLLELLFPDGIEHQAQLVDPASRYSATWILDYCYQNMGEPGRSLPVHSRLMSDAVDRDQTGAMNNFGTALFEVGNLADAERMFLQCVASPTESLPRFALYRANLGDVISERGDYAAAEPLLAEALEAFTKIRLYKALSDFAPLTAMFAHFMRQRRMDEAHKLARRSIALASTTDIVAFQARAFEMLGWSLMHSGLYSEAETAFAKALTTANDIGTASEVSISIAIAELSHRVNAPERARDILDDLWEPLLRGPLRLLHADACNVLADVELSAGRLDEAAAAAREAYRLAWCDGPPYCFAEGLTRARKILSCCGIPEPSGESEDAT